MLGHNPGEIQPSISKFERMLKTNLNYYFDPQEFEDIVIHYLGFGENQIAKQSVRTALDNPITDGILLEHNMFVDLFDTKDKEIGVNAFMDRSKPEWTGE